MTTPQTVDYPPHYQSDFGVECIDIAEYLTGNAFNILKYVWRRNAKGDPVENLKKALFYCEREKNREAAPNEGTIFPNSPSNKWWQDVHKVHQSKDIFLSNMMSPILNHGGNKQQVLSTWEALIRVELGKRMAPT